MYKVHYKIILLIAGLLTTSFLFAQTDEEKNTAPPDSLNNEEKILGYYVPTTIIEGDTVMHINLKQIIIIPPRVFKSKRERRRYTRLIYYVKKVYPYSQIVKQKLAEINREVNKIEDKKERKKFLKEQEDELRKEFEGELRKLTFTQGRILIKLINRETGETTYEIVKKLKGSLSAFFWQSVAVMFHSSLKYEYDAKGDDRMIEEIVILIENGQL